MLPREAGSVLFLYGFLNDFWANRRDTIFRIYRERLDVVVDKSHERRRDRGQAWQTS